METETLHAWILHKRNSGETSLNLTLFTAERGLLTCLYKGGRTAKKQGLIQSFTPCWIGVKNYSHTIYAQSIEPEAAAIPLSGDALISGLYLNELLYRILCPDSPQQAVFEAYLSTLTGLATAKNRYETEAFLRRFEWILLHANGYSLSLIQEARTGRSILPERQYQFIEGLGLVLAEQGLPGSAILAIAQDDLSDPETLTAAKYLMRKAINYLLDGARIKARNLYDQKF